MSPQEVDAVPARLLHAISDDWLEKHVEMALALDGKLDVGALKVDVRDGECFLLGKTGDDSQRDRAETIAAALEGVRCVRNNITVRD